jgi:hypothetical protein
MSNEKEYKYLLNDKTFEKIKKEKSYEMIGIIQWYLDDKEDKRYRLTLKKLPTGYFQEWTYTEKKETDDPSVRNEKEKSVSPEEIAEKFEEFKDFKKYKMVSKIRYVFKKDPEIVVDEFLSPYGHKINDENIENGLQYLLEIEEKEKPIKDFDEVLKSNNFPIDLLKSVDAEDNRYKNKNLATKFEGEESTLDIIEYVKNRLKGDITLVMPIGIAIVSKLKNYLYPDGGKKIINNNFYKLMKEHRINEFNYLSKDNESLVNDLSPEIGTLKKLINKGYNIKSVIAFIPKPYIIEDTKNKENNELNNIINLYNRNNWKDKKVSYSFLGNKIFFQEWFGIKEENIKAIPIEYDSKDENTIKNSFKEIWKKLDNLDIKNDSKDFQENNNLQDKKIEDDNYIIDIAPGLKYIGVIFSLYAMFNNKEFYYKQEYQKSLSKFSSFGIDWDYNFFDEFSSIANALDFDDEDKKIAIKDFLTLPENLKNVFTQINGEIKSFYPIKEIIKNYKGKRDMPFGFGDGFLQIFFSEEQPVIMKKMRNYIETMTKQKWSKQWIGDLIPETVEHSQRHSKRLLDFTANLLNVIGEDNFVPFDFKETPYQNTEIKYKFVFYFILAVAINVHDLGHTYSKFKYENDKILFLDKYPSLIRDLHNELTVQLIEEGINSNYNIFDILTPDKINKQTENKINYVDLEEIFKEKKNEIIDAIKLVCKYHRGYLAVDKKDSSSEKIYAKIFNLDIRPLEKVLENDYSEMDENLKKIIIHASKWLKFIDATDVQADRIITASHHIARLSRTKFEVLNLIEKYLINFPNSNLIQLIKEVKNKVENINTKTLTSNQNNLYDEIENISKELEDIVYNFIQLKISKKEFNLNDSEIELLNLISFKARQFPHFEKHRSVAAIYPTWLEWNNNEEEKKNNELILHLNIIKNVVDQNIFKDDDEIIKVIKGIQNEIKEELDKANITINGKKLKLSFEEKAEMMND